MDSTVQTLTSTRGQVGHIYPQQLLIKIVPKSCRILQKMLLNSVANDLLPFMVKISHESFTLLRVNDVGLFQHGQQANKVHRVYTGGTLKQT
jgi:hypothetical protein